MTDELPVDRIAAAVARVRPGGDWAPMTSRLITGGTSNLTYELSSTAGRLILRRPPLGTVRSTAHDLSREVRVIRALASTPVPVPEVVLYDEGVLLGSPCYVMRKVEGLVMTEGLPTSYGDSPEVKRELTHALVDTLAALHAVDVAEVGLADFGRPDGYLERQVRRWGSVWESVASDEVPSVARLGNELARAVPPTARPGIVHGDYRLDNCMISADLPPRIEAVLDWELSTYGDPLADLGALLFHWRDADEPATALAPTPTRDGGYPSRADVVERYVVATGADVSHLPFYRALACFKLAVLAMDVVVRGRRGAMGGQRFEHLRPEVQAAADVGLDVLCAPSS